MDNPTVVNNILTVDVVTQHKIATSNNMVNLISYLKDKYDMIYRELYNPYADIELIGVTRVKLRTIDRKINEVNAHLQELIHMDINSNNYMSREEKLCDYDRYIYNTRLIHSYYN